MPAQAPSRYSCPNNMLYRFIRQHAASLLLLCASSGYGRPQYAPQAAIPIESSAMIPASFPRKIDELGGMQATADTLFAPIIAAPPTPNKSPVPLISVQVGTTRSSTASLLTSSVVSGRPHGQIRGNLVQNQSHTVATPPSRKQNTIVLLVGAR